MRIFRVLVDAATAWPAMTLVLVVALAIVVQFFVKMYIHRRFFKDLPGPPHSFLLGHLKVMGITNALFPHNTHPQAIITEIARLYNLDGIFYLDMWPLGPSMVILSSPELGDQVYLKKPLGVHSMAADFLDPFTGPNGIAATNGPLWKRLHRQMQPAFSWAQIRGATGIMVEEMVRFRQTLDGLADSGATFSAEETVAAPVFDIVGRIVLSAPLHAQAGGSAMLDDFRLLIDQGNSQSNPALMLNYPAKAKRAWQRRQLRQRLDPMIETKILERWELIRGNSHGSEVHSRKGEQAGLLDLMLREMVAEKKEGGLMGKREKMELTAADMQLLVANMKGILLGAQGTTSDSICYILLLLSKSPSIVAKLCAEHNTTFGATLEETVDALLASPEKLQIIPYTEAVITEALRIFPLSFSVRGAPDGTSLSWRGRSYPVDNGLGVILSTHSIHYDERCFDEPKVFKPERWLASSPEGEATGATQKKNLLGNFRTFGKGPRSCLGKNLAMNEMKVALVLLTRWYEFTYVGGEPNKVPRAGYTDLDTVFGDVVFQELGVAARPRAGMSMKVKRR